MRDGPTGCGIDPQRPGLPAGARIWAGSGGDLGLMRGFGAPLDGASGAPGEASRERTDEAPCVEQTRARVVIGGGEAGGARQEAAAVAGGANLYLPAHLHVSPAAERLEGVRLDPLLRGGRTDPPDEAEGEPAAASRADDGRREDDPTGEVEQPPGLSLRKGPITRWR